MSVLPPHGGGQTFLLKECSGTDATRCRNSGWCRFNLSMRPLSKEPHDSIPFTGKRQHKINLSLWHLNQYHSINYLLREARKLVNAAGLIADFESIRIDWPCS